MLKICVKNFYLLPIRNLIVGIALKKQSTIVPVIDLFAETFSTQINENSQRYNDGQLVTAVALI